MTSRPPSRFPNGWTRTTIGEVCQLVAGVGFPKHLQGVTDADIPVFKVGDISQAWQDGQIHLNESPNTLTVETARSLSARLIPASTVVFAKIGAAIALNRRALTGRRSLVDNNVMGLVPCEGLDSLYLFYFSCTLNLQEYARATTVPSIRKGDVASISLPLPPHSEQHKVVEAIESYLSRLDAAGASLERVQAKLKAYRASVLKAAVSGRLVPTEATLARIEKRDYTSAEALLERILKERRRRWEGDELVKLKAAGKGTKGGKSRAKYAEPMAPEIKTMPELPEGWCWATVGQVADHRLGKMLDRLKNRGTPRPYLRNANVRWFTFDLVDVSKMRVQDTELDEVSVRAGDVVVCEGGEPGRAAVWQDVDEPFVIQKALHRVRPARGVSPWFFAYMLAAEAASGRLAKAFTGSTIKHFTGEAFRRYCVPLPPQDEQERIAEAVEAALSLIAVAERTVELAQRRSSRLRQAILRSAFEGKLVDQDPTDEPAERLLARIRADRAAVARTKKSTDRMAKGAA